MPQPQGPPPPDESADRVWLVFGIVGTGVTSAAITAFSLASLLWGLRGWRKD